MNSVFKVTAYPNEQLEKYKQRAVEELNDFFEKKGKERWDRRTPRILVVDDRETINKLYGRETEGWLVAWSWDRNAIVVLNPDNYPSESTHNFSENSFYKLIKHELCHCFLYMTFGFNTPSWLHEGIAIYASGQIDNYKIPEIFEGFLDLNNIYEESGGAVKLLIDNYGKDTFFKFLKEQSKVQGSKELSEVFEKIYKVELDYQFFNDLRKKETYKK